MLVHTYLTNGFKKNAEVFLESLYYIHKDDPPYVWMDTRGFSYDDVVDLMSYYKKGKITVNSLPLPMNKWARKAGLPVELMEKYKNECEQVYINENNKVWKLMTAGDDRVKRLYDVLWSKKFENIAHFDIDTLFRKPIVKTVSNLMRQADIWMKFRLSHNIVKARITIDCILVKPDESLKPFFDKWIYHIDRINPIERPVGWGQASCWHAYEEHKDEMKHACLPLEFGLPGRNRPENYVWNGNVHKLKKSDCAVMFKDEINKWKKS